MTAGPADGSRVRVSHLRGKSPVLCPHPHAADRRVLGEPHRRLAEDMPIVIESIDTASHIEAVTPVLQGKAPDALITTERVRVHIPGI